MHHVAHLHGARGFFLLRRRLVLSQGVLRLVELPAHLGARGVDALVVVFLVLRRAHRVQLAERALGHGAGVGQNAFGLAPRLLLRLFEPDLKLGAQRGLFPLLLRLPELPGGLGALAVDSRIRFAYRLEGYEEEWNETQPGDCMARYAAVPPGNYTLQVRATDELGRWSDEITDIEVGITPYFYKSIGFYLLLVVVICLAIYLFYKRKMRSYREQKARLEKEVELRTQELAVQNKQLETMAQHVKEITEEKIAFFTNITHEFRTPVTLIHGPIEHALKETQDEAVKAQLQIAERNSRYLLSLVNELMDFRKLDIDKVVLDKRSSNFIEFLSELLIPFRVFAKERHIDICTYFRLENPFLMIDTGYMRKEQDQT